MPQRATRPVGASGGAPESAPDLAAELSRTISRIHRSLRRRVDQALAADGLSEGMVEFLRLALIRPGLRVSEAASELSLAPNSVSTMVSRLVDAGLIERETDRSDRRVASLVLTPAGRAVLSARRDSRRAALGEGLAALDPVSRAQLEGAAPALRALLDALSGGPSRGRHRPSGAEGAEGASARPVMVRP